jgi:hypothetical protein
MTTPKPGVDSGFVAMPDGSTTFSQWQITVDNASAPLWFYCAQTMPANHCAGGMVFSVRYNSFSFGLGLSATSGVYEAVCPVVLLSWQHGTA